MAQQPPLRNLPPDAEQWGRWVDGEVLNSAAENTRAFQSIANSLTAIDGALGKLGSQITGLTEQQAISSLSTGSFTNVTAVATIIATTGTPTIQNMGVPYVVTLAPRSQVTAIYTSPVALNYNPPFAGDRVNGMITITATGGVSDYRSAAYMLQAPVANSQLGGEVTLSCVMNIQNTTSSPFSVSLQLGARVLVASSSTTAIGSAVVGNGTILLQSAYLAPVAPVTPSI